MAAVENDHTEVVRMLRKEPCCIPNKEGMTELHLAAINGNKDSVDLLLKHHADQMLRTMMAILPSISLQMNMRKSNYV